MTYPPLALGGCLATLALMCACGDNKVPLTDAGLASDAAPRPDADPSELRVIETSPGANALEADAEASIHVRFDRPLDRESITETSFWAFGEWSGTHRGGYVFSDSDRRVAIDSGRALIPGELVTVLVANTLRGAGGADIRSAGYSFQFRVGAKPASMTFTEIATLASRNADNDPGQSYGGMAADLDLDGYPDITVVNEKSEDLVIFMNRGDGTGMVDRVPSDYRVGIRPSPNQSGDFNGDGQTDIAVANIGGGVSVLLGGGDGSFGPETEYATGAGPRGLTVFDADGDGDMDIVNTNNIDDNLSLHLNNGDGTFAPSSEFDGGCNQEWAVSAADMDSDGIMDLVIGCHGDGIITVLTGDGSGAFTLRSTQQGPLGLWMIVTGDLNGDRLADVTVAGGFADNGAILLGDAAGNLGEATFYGTDPSTSATDIGDLDGDGDLDWITSSFGGDNSDWFFWQNDGAGVFSEILQYDSRESASCALLLDLDLDGDLDVALIDETADELILLRND